MAEIRVTKPDNYKENTIIISTETNAPLMALMYSNGLAANQNYMTLAEALAVTDITAILQNDETVVKFNEFEYFTNVTELPTNFANSALALEEITLPKSIKIIGDKAFCIGGTVYNAGKRSKLRKIDGLANVESVGEYAFQYQELIKEYGFTSKLKQIKKAAFTIKKDVGNSNVESFGDLSGVEYLGNQAFNGQNKIQNLYLPNVKTLDGNSVFRHCTNLKQLEFNYSDCVINGNEEFANTGLKYFPVIPSLNSVPQNMFLFENATFQNYAKRISYGGFPNAKSIGQLAFLNNYYVQSFGDLSQVESIAELGFGACNSSDFYLPVCSNVGVNAFQIDSEEESYQLEKGHKIIFGLPYEQITFAANSFSHRQGTTIICNGVELTAEQYTAVGATKPT